MVKKLIINADDFGATEGVTKGIIDCHKDGVLTSTTLLVNTPYSQMALNEAKKYPNLGVGIHLALTFGRPIVPGKKSFTDANGDFKKLNDYPRKGIDINTEELYVEWQAQIERFIELAGKLPTHIDSHHHVHMLPKHQRVVARLAEVYSLPVRASAGLLDSYEKVYFMGDFYGNDLTVTTLTDTFATEMEIMEVMCHPAYLDQETYDGSSYNIPRMKEMEILRSEELRQFIETSGIQLIKFDDIKKI